MSEKTTSRIPTESHEAMRLCSYQAQRELEINGRLTTSVPYVPTDWSKSSAADDEAFWWGYKESWGTCDKCWQMRSANGTCACIG